MKQYFPTILFILLIGLMSAMPEALYAAGTTQSLPNPLGEITIQALAGRLIRAALGIIGTIALAVFIYGGFLFLTAAGNPKGVETGKEAMKWAVAGIAIILFSYVIVNFLLESLIWVAQ